MSFSFPTVKINTIDVSDADFNKAMSGRSFVGPGTHSLKIVEVKSWGQNKQDSTFQDVQIVFEAPNGGQISQFLSVPTVRLKFNGSQGKKGELWPFQKLCRFFEGLGESVNQNAVPSLINKYFAKNTLPGMTVTGVVGFTKMHLEYLEGKYVLADRDGAPFITDSGTYVVQADDRDTAKARAVEAGFDPKKIQDFPEIVRYLAEAKDEDSTSSDDTEF